MSVNRNPLRAALIGCGRIGAHTADRLRETLPPVWFPYSHLDALREAPGVELAAVCDQNAEAARATAERHGVSLWYEDGFRLIDEVRPDILLIATRTEGRAALIEHAARRGVRGVHFEKPLARSLAECRKALSAAEAAGMILSYGAVRRYMDVPRAAKSLLSAGHLGPLRQVVVEGRRAELLWAHPHTFDLITFFFGTAEVTSVQARMSFEPDSWNGKVLDADPLVEGAAIQFSGGASALILSTGAGVTRLICEQGEYLIGGNTSWLAVHERAAGPAWSVPRQIETPFTASGRQRALMELAAAVRGEGESAHTAADILRSNQLGLACAWSAVNQGRLAALDEAPEDFVVTGRKGELFA